MRFDCFEGIVVTWVVAYGNGCFVHSVQRIVGVCRGICNAIMFHQSSKAIIDSSRKGVKRNFAFQVLR